MLIILRRRASPITSKKNAEGTVYLQAALYYCANHQVFDVSSCDKFFILFLNLC